MKAGAGVLLLVVLPTFAGWSPESMPRNIIADYPEDPVLIKNASWPEFTSDHHLKVWGSPGRSVTLACHVLNLGDKVVSWVRSRDLQILTHSGITFTADSRVSSPTSKDFENEDRSSELLDYPSDTQLYKNKISVHRLHIERLKISDTGRYECQINTEPKMSLIFNLTVEEGAGGVTVWARKENINGETQLVCMARWSGGINAPLHLRWSKDGAPLQMDVGGISVETEVGTTSAVSKITIASSSSQHWGLYLCQAGDSTASVHFDLSNVQIATAMESMQRDQSEPRTMNKAQRFGICCLSRFLIIIMISILL